MVARFVRCVMLVVLALKERGTSAEGVKAGGGGSPADDGLVSIIWLDSEDGISSMELSVRAGGLKATFFGVVMVGEVKAT